MKNETVPVRALAWTCAILSAGSAFAQGAATTIVDCHRIESSAERLACYDAASGRAGAKSAPPAPTAATPEAPAGSNVTTDAMSQAVAKEAAANVAPSMIDASWDFDPASPRYDIRFYRENYLLIGRYTDKVNTAPYEPLFAAAGDPVHLDSTEAKFQISFKSRLWTTDDRRWGAWAAYSQQSQWQLYNDLGNASRPFRETNYMPELILSYKPGLEWGGLKWNLVNLAFNHQSNGRSDTLSRSWNRLITSFGVESGNLGLVGRLWWRIPESGDSDDNPAISDYYGWGDLSAIYKWNDGQSFAATIRGNPSTGKGAGQLTWTTAPLLGPLRGYVKVFSGYGESLIDYNWNQSTIGIGVTLNDWL